MRPWGIVIFSNMLGAPMLSLGIHVEWHTPTIDLHVFRWTVQIGRNDWNGRRFAYYPGEQWHGHTDNCDHPRDQVHAVGDES